MYAVLHDTITALQYQWSHWKLHLVLSSGEIRTCSIGSPWFARATSHLFHVLERRYHGSAIPICASISSRALGEKSALIVVMVSPLTKYSRCLYGNEILVFVGGITGRSGRIKSPVCVPVIC